MPTDFFQRQDAARRSTGRLVLLFAAAVLGVIVTVYLVVVALLAWQMPKSARFDLWSLPLFLNVSAVTSAIVGLGSAYKLAQLSGGGGVVARDLGGRLVDPGTTDPEEHRLINVVEEMSLASGMPVPQMYVMDREEGINAFAAGFTTSDAVIGVTRGCLRSLSRDELQGVIAHEFSHILNGDMRLNLRLVGWIHGLLLIALIGRMLMEVRSGDRDKNSAPIALAGLALMAVGWAGVLFARMIQAGVSRQREHLADSSAVQFTRNPDGIAGALKKIGGLAQGSVLRAPKAEEMRHLMFGESVTKFSAALLATHPPLEERIRLLDPSWDGRFPQVQTAPIRARMRGRHAAAAGFSSEPPAPRADPAPAATPAPSPEETVARVGEATPQTIALARADRAGVPEEVMHLLHHPAGAQAVIFALLLTDEPESRATEHAALAAVVDAETLATVEEIERSVTGWHNARAIALIDLSMPALRRLTAAEYTRFTAILETMIRQDGNVALFEFMLQKLVRRHLDIHYRRREPGGIRLTDLRHAHTELSVLLSAAADMGSRSEAEARTAFSRAVDWLRSRAPVQPHFVKAGLPQISQALDAFDAATPLLKKDVLHACAVAVLADDTFTSGEAALLRAISDAIGCPMPPWVNAA